MVRDPEQLGLPPLMAHYILHIGYGKTGTTALQNTLAHNRDALASQGVIYPDARVKGSWLRAANHNMVARAVAGRLGWWGLRDEDYIAQFEAQRRSADAKVVLLSGEQFLGAVQPWDYPDTEAYWRAQNSVVARLRQVLDGHRVTLIVYLRRQDDWVESAINQTIKYGGLMGSRLANGSVDEIVDMYAPRLDYARTLDLWASHFGEEAICVGVYERQRLRNGDLIDDFLHRVGIDPSSLARLPLDEADSNLRLSRDVLEFKRILNRVPRSKARERFLAETLRIVSREMVGWADESAYPLLCPARREALLQEFAAGNADVARRYLGHTDGTLFTSPAAEDGGASYPGLSAETAVEILLRLERHETSLKGRYRLGRHVVAGILRARFPVLHGLARTMRGLVRRLA